ncbi:MAG: hypothetical protein ACOVK2_02870 [Candidatus Fonsibacter sp.]
MKTLKYEVKKLIISHNKGKVFHYWRDVKMIGKEGMFTVEEIEQEKWLRQSSSYVIYNKQKINNFDDIIDTIDKLVKSKQRDIKIKQLLG